MSAGLHRELFTFAIAGSLSLVALLLPTAGWSSLAVATLIFAFVWQRLWQFRLLNRRSNDDVLLDSLGWANRLTVLRGWLIAVCAGFLVAEPAGLARWLPAACYTVAVLLDGLDGSVARRSGRVTLLGIRLDTSMDALGLLVAPLVAVMLGKLHWSYLAVGAAYYLYQAGLQWRRHRAREVRPLRPGPWRRPLAGLQMAVVATALWPVAPEPLTQAAGAIVMVPFLAHFLYDWLTVSARV